MYVDVTFFSVINTMYHCLPWSLGLEHHLLTTLNIWCVPILYSPSWQEWKMLILREVGNVRKRNKIELLMWASGLPVTRILPNQSRPSPSEYLETLLSHWIGNHLRGMGSTITTNPVSSIPISSYQNQVRKLSNWLNSALIDPRFEGSLSRQ